MSNSPHWSSASAPCRFEWRPSRWLIAALCVLAVLAGVALWTSDLGPRLAWPLAASALGYGLWLAHRESRKPPNDILIHVAGARVVVDGERVDDFRVDWRGVLAFARWRNGEGRVHRRVWWPDTLPAATRRELRLAAPVETSPRDAASMAP